VLIFTAVIGPLITAATALILYRLGRQDRILRHQNHALRTIQVNVDGRLDTLTRQLGEALDLVHESRESGEPVPLPEANGK